MVRPNDDPPEFPDEISTSSKKAKLCFSLQPFRIQFPGELLYEIFLRLPVKSLIRFGCVSKDMCEISTSSKKAKLCFSLQPLRIQFPGELLYEIFLRLPVKSLIRFRCVSKDMCGMIDSPVFIKNHNIYRSVISERARSLSGLDSDDEEYAVFLYQYRLNRFFSVNFGVNDNLNRATAIELNCTFAKESMIPMGWGCNGIFGFKNSDPHPLSYVFWNPSNGTFRKVDCSSCLYSANVSMGYDYVNDDYKIIGFIKVNDEPGLQVYSFRKDSWRKVFHEDAPRLGGYGLRRAVCVRGVMHWLRMNRADKSIFIRAFDLATETFTSFTLPLEARQLQLWPWHFTDFRGRLCVTFCPRDHRTGYQGPQTIWVMEKYGVESSWTKLYDFERTGIRIENFYFPSSRGRLLCNTRCLCWWDPQDGSYERIEIPGVYNDQALLPELYNCDVYVYVRSLVRLDQSLF